MSDLNVYTTSQINALTPITGDMVVDSDLNAVKLYDGAAWRTWNPDSVASTFENRWGASFDGSSDYLSLGDLSTLSSASSFSISMWVDLSNWNGAVIYVPFTSGTGNSDRVCFYLNSLSEVRFGVNGSVGTCLFNLSTPVDYRNSGWHHLVGAYNGTDVTLFFDGTQVSTTTSSVPTSTSSTIGNSAAIGRETWSSSRYYNGKIDDLAIFDSALDQTAITALYGGGTPSEVSGAVGYWRMGDDSNDSATSGGSISTITDSSGNGNDAVQATASKQPTFKALALSTTSLSFNNSSDYLEKTFSSAPCAGAYTIGFWFKSTVNMNYLSIFESSDTVANYNGGFRIYRFGDGHIRLVSATTTGTWQAEVESPANATNLDTWHHIVITRSANGVSPELYIDGVTPSGTSYGTAMSEAISSTKLRIGSTYAGGLTGYMDEVSFFNSELTGSDLTAYLSAVRGTHLINDLSLSPTAYYRMGEDDSLADGDTVTQISDASGNGNHATQSTASNQPTASVDPIIYV